MVFFSCIPRSTETRIVPLENSDFWDKEDEGLRMMSDSLRLSPKPSSALLSIGKSLRRTGIARRTCSKTTCLPSTSLSEKLRRHHAHRQLYTLIGSESPDILQLELEA